MLHVQYHYIINRYYYSDLNSGDWSCEFLL